MTSFHAITDYILRPLHTFHCITKHSTLNQIYGQIDTELTAKKC